MSRDSRGYLRFKIIFWIMNTRALSIALWPAPPPPLAVLCYLWLITGHSLALVLYECTVYWVTKGNETLCLTNVLTMYSYMITLCNTPCISIDMYQTYIRLWGWALAVFYAVLWGGGEKAIEQGNRTDSSPYGAGVGAQSVLLVCIVSDYSLYIYIFLYLYPIDRYYYYSFSSI